MPPLPPGPVVVVWGPGLAREHGLDPALGGLIGAELGRDPARAKARAETLAAAAHALPPSPELEAVGALLAARPGGGVVSLAADGWPLAAGLHPVVELHGSLRRGRCAVCGFGPVDVGRQCPACGGWIRPDVVLGDEVVDPRRRMEAEFLIGRSAQMVLVGVSIDTPGIEIVQRIAEDYGLGVTACSGHEPGKLPDVQVCAGPVADVLSQLGA